MRSNSRVIVFASQKGGSGKTTLAGHIAVQAHLTGIAPVAVIDTDPQRSLAQWRQRREDNNLILKVSDVDNVEDDIAEMRSAGAWTIIIDTPPAATSAIGEVIRHADLVCIPTRPSPHDLRAVGGTIEIVEAHRKPMIFVLNSASARAKITGEAALALSQHGTVAPAIVHNRVDFAASMTDGRTVMELNRSSRSAGEIGTLWTYIGDRLAKIYRLQEMEVRSDAPTVGTAPSFAPTITQPDGAAVRDGSVRQPEVELPPAAAPPSEEAATAASNRPTETPIDGTTRPLTPSVDEFFSQSRPIKTPTYFGPERRRHQRGAYTGLERRIAAFGRRAGQAGDHHRDGS